MKQQPLSAAQETARRIAEMPPHKDYIPVHDLPIPTGYGVIVRPVSESLIKSTGLIIPDGGEFVIAHGSDKNKSENIGIIYAVGPKCGDGLKVGLKCRYLYSEGMFGFTHGIHTYIQTDEMGVPFIIPSDETFNKGGLLHDKEVGRLSRQARQARVANVDYERDMNEKDKKEEGKKKKKIFKV